MLNWHELALKISETSRSPRSPSCEVCQLNLTRKRNSLRGSWRSSCLTTASCQQASGQSSHVATVKHQIDSNHEPETITSHDSKPPRVSSSKASMEDRSMAAALGKDGEQKLHTIHLGQRHLRAVGLQILYL